MLYDIDLWLSIEDEGGTVHIDDLEEYQWDKIEDFEIETEYDQLTDILTKVIENCMFSDDFNIDKLNNLIAEAQCYEKDDVMMIIAYNEQYTIKSIDEFLSIDMSRIEVLEYDNPEDYLEDIISESYTIPVELLRFIDWEGYANSIGFNYQQATIDGENFIYTLT